MRRFWLAAAPLLAGFLFAIGLAVSGMTLPSKVTGFLDITGAWDPSLAYVMGGAVAVYAVAYQLRRRRRRPLFAPTFADAPASPVDARLLVGSALFGVGWGLAGYCPGPALVSLATGSTHAIVFCVAMVAAFGATWKGDALVRRGGN